MRRMIKNTIEPPLTKVFDINTIEYNEIKDSLINMYNTKRHHNEPIFDEYENEYSLKCFNQIKHGSRNVYIRESNGHCRKLIYNICRVNNLKFETWKENTFIVIDSIPEINIYEKGWRYWTVGVHVFRYIH